MGGWAGPGHARARAAGSRARDVVRQPGTEDRAATLAAARAVGLQPLAAVCRAAALPAGPLRPRRPLAPAARRSPHGLATRRPARLEEARRAGRRPRAERQSG